MRNKRMAERKPRSRESSRAARNREFILEDMTDADLERITARRKRKRGGTLLPLIVVLLIAILGGASFGGILARRYAPSTERKDLNEWFEAQGDTVRIYLNDKLVRDVNARSADGTVYLPCAWVQENLNKRFYWQADDEQLIYTLPDEVVRYTASSTEKDGTPVYRVSDSGMELNLATVQEYTDIRVDNFAQETESAKRIFIYNDWSPVQRAKTKRNAQLRTKGGVKAPILTDVPEGGEVTVLEAMEKWSRVLSPDGMIGFMRNKDLGEASEYTYTSDFKAPAFTHQTLPEKVVLGWHMVFSKTAANSTLEEYTANTQGVMNVISPTGIQISDAEGNYQNYIDGSYVQKAHELGLKVWVMVDNFNQPGGLRDFSTKDYFAHAANRQDFIDRLMADADAYGYDGFNLDFESLPTEAGPSYVQFYRELSVACRKKGLVLSIDNYVPYDYNNHYDLGEQSDFADYIIIMGYDEHTNDSEEAGSVASIGYTKLGIEKTLEYAAPEHVINGVPFFTRVWKSSGPNLSSDAMGINDAKNYVEEQGIELNWDEETGQYYGRKDSETGTRQVWMEEERSIAEKMKVVEENKLGGVAGWRLQYEPADIWKELDLNGVLGTASQNGTEADDLAETGTEATETETAAQKSGTASETGTE